MTHRELAQLAIDAMGHAYAPYSGHWVGAALLCSDGTVYQGANLENAAYGPTVCAERVAIFKAVYDGHRDFSAIAICGGPNGDIKKFCAPCGVCRQVLREFCRDEFEILLVGPEGALEVCTLGQLLPHSFSPADLEV
jgi:cytidine deaminase